MTKKEKLKQLDDLVLTKMLELISDDRLDEIPSLSVSVAYLKANQEVSEKEKKTTSDHHKELIKEAKKRREEKAFNGI